MQQIKELNRKYYELQQRYSTLDKEKKDLMVELSSLKKDKKIVTERWIRATSQIKQGKGNKSIINI